MASIRKIAWRCSRANPASHSRLTIRNNVLALLALLLLLAACCLHRMIVSFAFLPDTDRLDQLNVIFDVIGTPTASDIQSVASEKVLTVLARLLF